MPGTTYVTAKREVRDLVAAVMREHHPLLVEAGVTVNVLMAWAADGEPAVKLHGYPCYAVIKLNSMKDRVEGKADATLTIDSDLWDDDGGPGRLAMLDHELHHLDPEILKAFIDEDTGEERHRFKHDGAGRPKLKLRLHDLVVGGFRSIVERHGAAAAESRAIRQVIEATRQLMFDFADGGDADLAGTVVDAIEADPGAFAGQVGPGVTVEVRRSRSPGMEKR